MARWEPLSGHSGKDLVFDFEYARNGVPIDLRPGSAEVYVTGKRSKDDADNNAVFRIGNAQGLTGVQVDPAAPGNLVHCTVPGSVTASLTETETLHYEATVKAPDSREEVVMYGPCSFRRSVSVAP